MRIKLLTPIPDQGLHCGLFIEESGLHQVFIMGSTTVGGRRKRPPTVVEAAGGRLHSGGRKTNTQRSPISIRVMIAFFLSRPGSKIWIRARSKPPRTLQMQKHPQIRHLGGVNPMEGFPDQDSATKSLKNKFQLYFACPSNPG